MVAPGVASWTSPLVGDSPWNELAGVLAVGVLAYVAVVVVLRISGKRTLAKLNAFDLVVTVAIGSVLASTIVASGTSLLEGAAAIVVLTAAQSLVSWWSVRSGGVRRAARSSPVLLVWQGVFEASALRSERVTEGEVRQAVRGSGVGDLAEVGAVVLETDGTISVITSANLGDASALQDVDESRRRIEEAP